MGDSTAVERSFVRTAIVGEVDLHFDLLALVGRRERVGVGGRAADVRLSPAVHPNPLEGEIVRERRQPVAVRNGAYLRLQRLAHLGCAKNLGCAGGPGDIGAHRDFLALYPGEVGGAIPRINADNCTPRPATGGKLFSPEVEDRTGRQPLLLVCSEGHSVPGFTRFGCKLDNPKVSDREFRLNHWVEDAPNTADAVEGAVRADPEPGQCRVDLGTYRDRRAPVGVGAVSGAVLLLGPHRLGRNARERPREEALAVGEAHRHLDRAADIGRHEHVGVLVRADVGLGVVRVHPNPLECVVVWEGRRQPVAVRDRALLRGQRIPHLGSTQNRRRARGRGIAGVVGHRLVDQRRGVDAVVVLHRVRTRHRVAHCHRLAAGHRRSQRQDHGLAADGHARWRGARAAVHFDRICARGRHRGIVQVFVVG